MARRHARAPRPAEASGIADVEMGCDERPETLTPLWSSSAAHVYTHGYSARVALPSDPNDARRLFRKLGWSPRSRSWGTSAREGRTYARMRGSAWLSHRAPRQGRTPLRRFNEAWKTAIYSMGIEIGPKGVFVDLQGVRLGDVDRVVRVALGVTSYQIVYYRRIERYVVLQPHEAHRFAEALGSQEQVGSGRLSRKQWLVRDFPIAVTVKTRTRATAFMSVYRISRGATAAYRCEIVLAGKRADRGEFGEADVATLDAALLRLLEEHGIATSPKPARWEPVGGGRPPRSADLARLPAAAYRGRRPNAELRRLVAKCHIDGAVKLLGSPANPGTLRAPARVSTHPLPSGSSATDVIVPQLGVAIPYARLIAELDRLPGHVAEVILDAHVDPGPLLRALVGGPPGPAAVVALGVEDQIWTSVLAHVEEYPVTETTRRLVLVVDPSACVAVSDAVSSYDEESGNSAPGPIVPSVVHPLRDPIADHVRAMAAWLDPVLHDLRHHCERTGLQLVLVTVDARPDHGRGVLQRAHFYRDARVRSLLGDAARYHCHVRYHVETDRRGGPTAVTMWKDEAEGLMGRRQT